MLESMNERKPTLADLISAYGRALIAKVQMREFSSWGGGVMDGFRKAVAEHETMEREYLDRVSAERAAADKALKEK